MAPARQLTFRHPPVRSGYRTLNFNSRMMTTRAVILIWYASIGHRLQQPLRGPHLRENDFPLSARN